MADRSSKVQIPSTIAAVLWLAVFPFFQKGSYAHITKDKWEAMLLLTCASVLLTVAALLFCKEEALFQPPRDGKHTLLRYLPQLLCLLYFLWVALSAAFGSAHDQINSNGQSVVLMGAVRYEGLITQIGYLLIFLSLSLCMPGQTSVSLSASLGLLLFAGFTTLQYAGYNPLHLYPEGLSISTNPEFQGTIGNIDMISGYLVLTGSLLFTLFYLKGGWFNLAGGAAAALLEACIGVSSGTLAFLFGLILLFVMMLSHSERRCRGWMILSVTLGVLTLRSVLAVPWPDGREGFLLEPFPAWQGILAMLWVLSTLAAIYRNLRPGSSLPRKVIAWVLIIFIVLSLLILFFFPSFSEGSTLWQLQQILHGRGRDWFGAWRFGVWRLTLFLSKQHLAFGSGPDTFWYIFNPHWKQLETQLIQDGTLAMLGRDCLEGFDNPHNEFLAVLSNNGLPALVLYLSFLGSVLYGAFHLSDSRLKKAAAVATLLYAVQSFFSFSNCLVTPMFWAIAGIASYPDYTGFSVRSV